MLLARYAICLILAREYAVVWRSEAFQMSRASLLRRFDVATFLVVSFDGSVCSPLIISFKLGDQIRPRMKWNPAPPSSPAPTSFGAHRSLSAIPLSLSLRLLISHDDARTLSNAAVYSGTWSFSVLWRRRRRRRHPFPQAG